eukprot:scaffold161651_cov44-Prasinocladus_malaysianus.AAC.2
MPSSDTTMQSFCINLLAATVVRNATQRVASLPVCEPVAKCVEPFARVHLEVWDCTGLRIKTTARRRARDALARILAMYSRMTLKYRDIKFECAI